MNNSMPTIKPQAERTTAPVVAHKILVACFITPIGCLLYSRVAYGQFSLPLVAQRNQSDYLLMVVQCSVGIAITHIPAMAEKHLRINIPPFMKVVYSTYLFCAIFLGEVLDFYHLVPGWDSILHLNSGIMLGLLGCMVFVYSSRKQGADQQLSPALVTLFAFCFSMCAGALWEIYEYMMDSLLDLNMQKTILQGGQALAGRAALMDTMKDIILDALGAGVAAVICHHSVKHNKDWVRNYLTREEGNSQLPPYEKGKSQAA